MPKIYRTKSGKKYFVINGRKVFVSSKLSTKEILAIYKILARNVKKTKKREATNVNKATAIVNITHPTRRRRKATNTPSTSTIDPAHRVSTSGPVQHPKDSGNKDLINGLINDTNAKRDELTRLINANVEEKKQNLLHPPPRNPNVLLPPPAQNLLLPPNQNSVRKRAKTQPILPPPAQNLLRPPNQNSVRKRAKTQPIARRESSYRDDHGVIHLFYSDDEDDDENKVIHLDDVDSNTIDRSRRTKTYRQRSYFTISS